MNFKNTLLAAALVAAPAIAQAQPVNGLHRLEQHALTCRFDDVEGDRFNPDVVPLRRIGTPEDYGEAILWLAAGANYVTGQCLNVDGGMTT